MENFQKNKILETMFKTFQKYILDILDPLETSKSCFFEKNVILYSVMG